MAKIFLVPPARGPRAFDHFTADFEIVERAAATAVAHVRAREPEEADVILFVGSRLPLQKDIRRHPLARRFPERTVVYDSDDRPIPFLRGIYPSIERRWHRASRTRSGFYLRWSDAASIVFTDPASVPRYLFGFVGAANTHQVRRRVLGLRHRDALLRDSATEPGRGFGQSETVYAEYIRAYAEDLAAVRFVLCPRGVGTSSMRIFEAMKAGRPPVVISDEWVPPDGPAWDHCSLRIRERDVERIPELVASRASDAAEMGWKARKEWETYFAPARSFETLASWSEALIAGPWRTERRSRALAHLQLLRPYFLRYHLLARLWRSVRRTRGR
jgi:hypothetical protein